MGHKKRDLVYTWEQFYSDVRYLIACKVYRYLMGVDVDYVVSIANGGTHLGQRLSSFFDVPLLGIKAKSYVKGLQLKNIDVGKLPLLLRPEDRVIVADDILDTGRTMECVCKKLKKMGVDIVLKVALFKRESLVVSEDCVFVEIAQEGDWVIFPWEVGEE